MNKLIVVIALLTLAGCTTNAKTHAVRGVSGIEIDCSGLGSGWEKCRKRANKECKAGYKVVARSDDAKDEDEYPFGFNPAGYLTRTMLVICR
ncbi:hypothetical protein ASC74_06520 [Pseudomonas sp. Root329]|uniref:hypothetical protein n=1 Tax=Pseudomonas sp. Root329 TaxID=1736515 RepID=UPI0006F77781|nr:hypothetical protein [Pseudomonas sp. Root329]KQV12759.1 hypothetical protein ASC74_06520 [Pseudomonas sp. Root329]